MEIRSAEFKKRAVFAIHDQSLQQALGKARDGFVGKRAIQAAEMPEFEALREEAKNLKNHILDNLDHYLERYEAAVSAAGGHVHWARDAQEARRIILDICKRVNAKTVTKGKILACEFSRSKNLHPASSRRLLILILALASLLFDMVLYEYYS